MFEQAVESAAGQLNCGGATVLLVAPPDNPSGGKISPLPNPIPDGGAAPPVNPESFDSAVPEVIWQMANAR